MKHEIIYINIYDIVPNSFQPRIKFDDNKLNELANSIKKYGIICPLILRKKENKYEIIAGERRYKAALMVGLQTVPSIVMELDDKEGAELALIENVQREDLNSIEEANSYNYLIKTQNQTKDQLAQSISKNIASIEAKLKFLDLTPKVKDALLNNLISEGHAKVLLKLNDSSNQDMMLDRIIKERLNVKDASNEVNIINNNSVEKDIVNLKELNQPDLALERNNINNALNEINLEYENKKGDNNMNEFNNMMNNNMMNGGNISEPQRQNKFFPDLEDQQVNLNSQPTQPQNEELVIPTFNPTQFNAGTITPQPNLNNQNPFIEPTIPNQTLNIPSMETPKNEINIPQNNSQMPVNEFNSLPQMDSQSNPFQMPQQPEQQNPFDTSNINNNPFAAPQEQHNPFVEPNSNQFGPQVNNNPFDINQAQNVEPVQPINNIPEIKPMNEPVQINNSQMPVDNNYGVNFAPQVNQPNPAIDKIKILVAELKNNGFNIELSEADLMDSFQLTINIKK